MIFNLILTFISTFSIIAHMLYIENVRPILGSDTMAKKWITGKEM